MNSFISLVFTLFCLALQHQCLCQQQFTQGQIPRTFTRGTFFPTRPGLTNVLETEEAICRPIVDQIDRNSARFRADLVTNTNRKITFANADSRIMSSRMQSRLDTLADLYSSRMTIVKAWSQYPDPELRGLDRSLHYEGRTVSVTIPDRRQYDAFLKLALQAAFDWVYYESSNRVRLSVIPSSCERSIDVVFMLDRSGSVGRTNHGITLNFVRTAVSFFTIGSAFSRVGVVAYATSSSIQFDLKRHTTLSSLQRAIDQVRYTGGATNTPASLDHARLLLTPSNNRGARPNSAGIPKIAILITDGRSNRGSLRTAISNIRNTDIQVYAVGIGNIDQNELRDIATDPDDDHVFILRNYLDAAGFVDFLSATTCDTPAVIDPGDNVTTEGPGGGVNYFQTSCSIFSNNVLVELIDITGTSFLYASSVVSNPGPLTPNTVSNTTVGINRRTITVPLTNNLKVVYIGVQGQSDIARFTILVWDQLFSVVEAFISVVEGIPAGSTIYEVNRNLTSTASRNRYEYGFIEGITNSPFDIDRNSGRVFIRSGSRIDFNTQQAYTLTVKAQNVNQRCHIGRIRINIRVISNQITFTNIPPQSVSETTPLLTRIVQVIASGGAGRIEYSIVGGNQENKFRVNPSTGRIILDRSLNFETTQSYTIRVRAVSMGTNVNGEINVIINVLDVNERPYFTTSCANTTSGCSYNIAENVQASALGSIVANDPDLSTVSNGMLAYQLSSNSIPFSIDSAGRLRTTRPLDRERRSSYTFTLTVRDRCSSGCSLSISTTIRVTVTDVNDNSPVFTSNPHTVQVSEDLPLNMVVAEYRATDADIGSNADIVFTLTPNTVPFGLSSTGTLSLTGSIDYETTQSYSVTITASNPGTSLRTTSAVTILILNVNDNTPVITGEPYEVTVLENSATGTVVTTVTATDRDLGVHGEIRYFIVSGNIDRSFAINSVTGEVTVAKNIDREAISSFSLVVRARDRGTPNARQDMTTISVTVGDENDNTPIFRPQTYSVQLREDIPVGRNVTQVLATDNDQPDTPNSRITFSINSGNTGNVFRILASGQIQVNQMLDFETTPSYVLIVEGRDGGSPRRSATASVRITIINVNENPPTLSGDQTVNVSELAPINTRIARFQAQDQDQMAITLSIASGNMEGKFAIDSGTGTITTVATLDYEITTSYSLTIRASDGQQFTDSSLTVLVLDENEHSPIFMGPNQFMIREQSSTGSTVGTVKATDGDRDDAVTFEFVGQNVANEKFILNSLTGVITTNGILDRENLTQVFTPPLSQVTLQVSATDNGSPSRQSFRDYTITLVDINDNAPIFSDTMYANQLRENLPSGQVVFSTIATDVDLGTNADITYSFSLTNNQGSSNPFQINSATGTITTTTSLDCELQPFYLFSITATDTGSPPMSSTVTGNLSLIDENDNSPMFSRSIYFITIPESHAPGTTIMTFTATDADKGLNGEVQYSVESRTNNRFIEGEEDVEFMIDSSTGRLFAVNFFDYERDPQVNVTVFANDRGLPRRTTSALLIITVTNVDEIAPFFQTSQCMSSMTVSENVPVGFTVGHCVATDEDSIATGNQPPITYSTDNQYFNINSTTGAITTKVLLDRESFSNAIIGLQILATDLANQDTSRTIEVSIADVNDNSPQFQDSPYAYHFTDIDIRDNKQEFLAIQASDPDFGSNGTFSFNIGSTIQISETESRVEVIAQDNGIPSMNSFTNVTVTFQSPCQLQRYSISTNNGEGHLSAELLCSVVIASPSIVFTLDMSDALMCRISQNTIAEVQWLHNGTTLTNPELVQSNASDVELALNNIIFSSAGQYACKASSSAGSLQSTAKSATIQVTPVIIVQPQDTSAEIGSAASFNCKAIGTPSPSIQWFVGTRLIGSGSSLSIPTVNETHANVYACVVSNSAGTASASARLVVFDKLSVLQVELANINNPSSDGSCQYFDPSQLENTITTITKQKVMVSSTSGSNLCELSPCSPSPCRNRGTCDLKDVVGGYDCTCQRGYTGVNCTLDEDECSQSPCGDYGECMNTEGSYSCSCNQNYTGRLCQFEKRCTPNLCSGSEVCLEVYSGYECKAIDPTNSVVVSNASVTPEKLTDLVQASIDQALQASSFSSTTNQSRRKRQVTSSASLNTSCQPNFVTHESGLILLWTSCPANEAEPTSEQQQALCSYFFELGVVAQCKSPNGEIMVLPTVPTPSSTSVKVNLIFVDENNKPIDAKTSIEILQNQDILNELASNGVRVASAEALETQPSENSSSQSNISAALGGVIGGVLGLALLAVLIIIVIIVAKKKAETHKEKQKKKKEKAQQMLQLEPGEFNTMKKMSTIASTASTDNLIASSDGNDYDELPPVKTSQT